MSVAYNEYIDCHKNAVETALMWMKFRIWNEIVDILPDPAVSMDYMQTIIEEHDLSKYEFKEYEAYDNFFYGPEEKTPEVEKAFNKAWLHHIHANPHHWQHWVLFEDDGGVVPLEMQDEYILEMLCDWWSFSWIRYLSSDPADLGLLYGIFDWYDENKEHQTMHPVTRDKVERLLGAIRRALDITSALL